MGDMMDKEAIRRQIDGVDCGDPLCMDTECQLCRLVRELLTSVEELERVNERLRTAIHKHIDEELGFNELRAAAKGQRSERDG